MCGPSCILAYFVARLWDRYRETRWRAAIGVGLAPLTVGLVAASAWLLSSAADLQWRLAAVTLATALVGCLTKLNPLWCLGAAAGLGFAGLL
jgi:chromate transporter